mmetsp:Transcript_36561/g.67002  ORF Transcript_36561/g.67002 Transcript_36561/m.67002 type:complete len:220 (+) Transcript_36561:372-1031(+)
MMPSDSASGATAISKRQSFSAIFPAHFSPLRTRSCCVGVLRKVDCLRMAMTSPSFALNFHSFFAAIAKSGVSNAMQILSAIGLSICRYVRANCRLAFSTCFELTSSNRSMLRLPPPTRSVPRRKPGGSSTSSLPCPFSKAACVLCLRPCTTSSTLFGGLSSVLPLLKISPPMNCRGTLLSHARPGYLWKGVTTKLQPLTTRTASCASLTCRTQLCRLDD